MAVNCVCIRSTNKYYVGFDGLVVRDEVQDSRGTSGAGQAGGYHQYLLKVALRKYLPFDQYGYSHHTPNFPHDLHEYPLNNITRKISGD